MFPRLVAAALSLVLAIPVAAETTLSRNGSDTFVAGDSVLTTLDERGDSFVAASTAILGGVTTESLHVAGYDISVGTNAGGDLYAAGVTVEIDAETGGDMTAAGFSVTTTERARAEGNVRLAGNSVHINGPVAGALSVMGRNVILNAVIEGDVSIAAGTLEFGEAAEVRGRLSYSAPDQITVPERVAPPERVSFTTLDIGDEWRDMASDWPGPEMPRLPGAMAAFGTFLVSLLFLLVIGGLALAFFPDRLERLRDGLASAPGRTMVAGIAGLALLIGLLPVAIMTLVGIPFVPVILLALVVAWILGYALGAYAIAVYVWGALGNGDGEPSVAVRLALLAAAVTVVALFNFIPFVGWVVNFTIVLLGIGAMARPLLARLLRLPEEAAAV